MQRRTRHADQGSLANELAGLSALDRPALMKQWKELYGTEATANISHSLLVRAIAYRLQENALGGLKPATRRFLEKAAEKQRSGKTASAPSSALKPGMRLLREWHGTTHEVIVLEDGIQFQGKRYQSLSEVARAITSTRWSGPLFFGLKKRGTA